MSEDRKDQGPRPGEQQRGIMGGRGRGPGGFGGMMGRGPAEKPKDFFGTMKRLIVYLKPHAVQMSFVVLFAVLSTIFNIIGPKILGQATTKLFDGLMAKYAAFFLKKPMPSIDFTYIGQIIILLIILYLISALFGYIQQYQMAGVSQKTVFDMRRDVNAKLSRLPLKFFDSRTHGEIMSRVTNDIDNISTTLQQSLTQLITSVCTIIGVLVMMLTISPLLTLITFVTLPLSFIITANIAKLSQKYFGAQQKELGALNGHVEEMYTGHKIVKVFGHEHKSIKEFDEINGRLYHAGMEGAVCFRNNFSYDELCQ